jgi:hypothetical protein
MNSFLHNIEKRKKQTIRVCIIFSLILLLSIPLITLLDKNKSKVPLNQKDDNSQQELKSRLKSKIKRLEEKLNERNKLNKNERKKLTDEITDLKKRLSSNTKPSNDSSNSGNKPSNKSNKPVNSEPSPSVPPSPTIPSITNEEAKKQVLEELSKLFELTPEQTESFLLSFKSRTSCVTNKEIPLAKLAEKLEAELVKNNKDVYSSFPTSLEEMQEGINHTNYRNSFIFVASTLPQKDNDNSID